MHAFKVPRRSASSIKATPRRSLTLPHGFLISRVAAKGGAPATPIGVGNIQTNPEVEAEVASGHGTETFTAKARVVEDRSERDRLFAMMSTIWPSFIDYQKRTDRLIPVVILKRR